MKMDFKKNKLLFVTLTGLSSVGVTLVVGNSRVEASPYVSGQESAGNQNTKDVVVNLVDENESPITWTQADGTSGGTSIEYHNQDGDKSGMSLIKLPVGVYATSATSTDQGQIFSVNAGQFYVDLDAISGTVAHFTLNATYTPVNTVTSGADTGSDSLADSSAVSSSVAPSASSSVAPSMSSSAGSSVSSSAIVDNQIKSEVNNDVSASSETSSLAVADSSVAATTIQSDVVNSAAQLEIMQPAKPVYSIQPMRVLGSGITDRITVAPVMKVIAVSGAPVAMVNQPVEEIAQQAATPDKNVSSESPAVVKKSLLLSSVSDLPKATVWNDKSRAFSALSVGASLLAVVAQFAIAKLGLLKNLLQ